MKRDNVNRREFSQWTMAALGGLVSGAAIGCGDGNTSQEQSGTETSPDPSGEEESSKVAAHACRGLNDCKSANNDCRGQGTCATASWHHECAGQNECKGQGGCGNAPLTNDCSEKGSCRVPLMDHAWETARKNMEEKWTAAGADFGKAPAPPES